MKLILLAATALIAAPVMAQTSGSTGTSSPTTSGAQGSATTGGMDQTTTGTTPTDTSMPAEGATDTTMSQTGTAAPMSTGSGDPVGGYAPTGSAISGGTPGAAPMFRQAQTPDQAYPAPAPMAKYPVCKKGQFDKYIQRGGK